MFCAFFVGFFCCFSLPAWAQGDAPPIVLELFTSQSCSSCPPADRLLASYAGRPEVIALGCHVTYWNHLSWRDTLSHDFCTQRQRHYAAASGTQRVFTPELRINGARSVVGSDTRAIAQAVKEAGGTLDFIAIEPQQGRFMFSIPPESRPFDHLTVLVYGHGQTQSIQSGENRGRTVFYTNPVIAILPLSSEQRGIDAADMPQQAAGFAILAQENSGVIVAAGAYQF